MRLIDADALYDELYENMGEDEVLDRIPPCYVDDAPTVDAVPVVRCGECIYFDPEGHDGVSCAETGAMIWPNEDDYCSRGQRRDQFSGGGKTGGQNDADQH